MPTATTLNTVRKLAEFSGYADLRRPTAAEEQLLAEACEAGACISGYKWREYFGGERTSLPIQFERGYVHCEDYGNPAYEEPAALAREARDHYLARVSPGGDLFPLVEQVSAEHHARGAAAQREAA